MGCFGEGAMYVLAKTTSILQFLFKVLYNRCDYNSNATVSLICSVNNANCFVPKCVLTLD